MRILYHHRTRAGDAQGVHIAEMQRAFRAAGHVVREVALVASRPEAAAAGNVDGLRGLAGLTERAARRSPRLVVDLMALAYNAVIYRRLLAAATEFRPQVVYERAAAFTVAAGWAAERLRVPLVLEVNAPLAQELRRERAIVLDGVARRLERAAARRATWVLTVSDVLRDLCAEQGGEPGRLHVVRNGVRRGFGDHGDGARGRSRWAIPRGVVTVGVVGWFRPWHGLDALMAAARSPRWREAGIHLVLAGEGPALAPLAAELRALGGAVTVTGAVERDELEDLLAALDIAVQPAVTPYACPMKLIEYMASGRAIVAPARDNVRELLTHQVDALLCGEDADPTPAALLEAILELGSDALLRRRLGAAARRRVVEQGLFWEENVRRIEALLGPELALPSRPAADAAFEAARC